jgi:hypothetical protein
MSVYTVTEIVQPVIAAALSMRALVISYGATAEAAFIEVANACFTGLRATLLRLWRTGLRQVRPGVARLERAQAATRPRAQSTWPRACHRRVPAFGWLTNVST